MLNEQIIKCVFCKGLGNNPHFKGTCPVCKGRGKNEVAGKYMTCSSCRGLGQKKGTTLTCFDCDGLGVIPDTRETFRKARKEIGQARKDLARERQELTEKPMIKIRQKRKEKGDEWRDEKEEGESSEETRFCQCCASEVNSSIQIKICHDCFGKMKKIV